MGLYMKPLYQESMPPKLIKSLKKLGNDISIARRKRNLTIDMMCERARLSKQTYKRIEDGNPSVAFGAIAMVLFALGEEHRINELIDISKDEVGLMLDVSSLPKRVRRK